MSSIWWIESNTWCPRLNGGHDFVAVFCHHPPTSGMSFRIPPRRTETRYRCPYKAS
jgi:hypothetical protein